MNYRFLVAEQSSEERMEIKVQVSTDISHSEPYTQEVVSAKQEKKAKSVFEKTMFHLYEEKYITKIYGIKLNTNLKYNKILRKWTRT